jgi:hypothetical protein
MKKRQRGILGLVLLLLLVVALLSACDGGTAVSGKWRTDPPASLLYIYTDDGAVQLLKDNVAYPVFRYELLGENTIRLYDGMGRMQEYGYELSDDTLIFFDSVEKDRFTEIFTREE